MALMKNLCIKLKSMGLSHDWKSYLCLTSKSHILVNEAFTSQESSILQKCCQLFWYLTGVMGEYEPKIEVRFPETIQAAKDSSVKLECFALGK